MEDDALPRIYPPVVPATIPANSPPGDGGSVIAEPENAALPTVYREGFVIQALPGTWTGGGEMTFTYQWKRGGTNVSGQTAAIYSGTANPDDILAVAVQATNAAGSASATSANYTVPYDPPVNTVSPALSYDNTNFGTVVTCSQGTWTGSTSTKAFQWYRGASPISGATANTYTLAVADNGQAITCRVTATNPAGVVTAVSNTLQMPARTGPVNTADPVVTGNPNVVGAQLSSTNGTWNSDPAITGYTYQWQRNGVNIAGATSNTYAVTLDDEVAALVCRVTAANIIGSAAATSNAVNVDFSLALQATDNAALSWGISEGQYGHVHNQVVTDNSALSWGMEGQHGYARPYTESDAGSVGYRLRGMVEIGTGGTEYYTAVNTDTPTCYWKLDETSGTAITDTKGTANGVIAGSYTLNQGSIVDAGIGILVGNASTQGQVTVTGTVFDPASLTASGWFFYNGSNASINGLFSAHQAGSGSTLRWQLELINGTTGIPTLQLRGASGAVVTFPIPYKYGFASQQWFHVAVVQSGSDWTVYFDGDPIGTATLSKGSVTGNVTFIIGGGSTGRFTGKIDEVAFFSSAVSATRIKAHYNTVLPSVA